MDLIPRVQNLIMKPKEEWVKIKGESAPVPQLFMNYALFLVLISGIAQFVGYGLVGVRVPFVGVYRVGIISALLRGVVFAGLQLVSAYIFGMVINALAPTFGSKPNLENAMKLAVYSMTPGWIGGVFYIIPALAFLAFIASLYGLYVMYLGFASPMMDTPQDKVMGYTVASVVAAIVLTAVISLVVGAIFAIGAVSIT
jgi:Yip1 domain